MCIHTPLRVKGDVWYTCPAIAMNKCITVALVCVYKYMCRVKRSIVCNRRERECVCVCVCVCVCMRAREGSEVK